MHQDFAFSEINGYNVEKCGQTKILQQEKGTCIGSSKSTGGGMESYSRPVEKLGGGGAAKQQHSKEWCGHFQMPLHYPRYTRAEYEDMPEWKLDCLLGQYGLSVTGDVNQKRKFAMGAFLWSL